MIWLAFACAWSALDASNRISRRVRPAPSSPAPIDTAWIPIARPGHDSDRVGHACVYDSVNDKIYMYGGGHNTDTLLHCLDRYDPVRDTWERMADMLTARIEIKGLCCRGRLYAMGGFDSTRNLITSCEAYDTASNAWSYIAGMPMCAAPCPEAVWRDSLIFIMGCGASESVMVYDAANDRWATSGFLTPDPFEADDACIIGDTIYVAGSLDATRMFKGIINPANPLEITWSEGPCVPCSTRFEGPTVAVGGRVYFFGGYFSAPGNMREGWVYNPGSGAFDTLPDLPTTVDNCFFGVARSHGPVRELYKIAGDDSCNWYPPNCSYYRLSVSEDRDLSVTRLVAPTTAVDSGDTVTPRAEVQNCGVEAVGARVRFRIDDGFADYDSVFLQPGESTQVSFTPWVALKRGQRTAQCSTMLQGDEDPGNDAQSATFMVHVAAVEFLGLTELRGILDSGITDTPSGTAYNYGTDTVGMTITLRIGPGYRDRESIPVAPGGSQPLHFSAWTPLLRGSWPWCCSLACGSVVQAETGHVVIRVTDAGVKAINWPAGVHVGLGANFPRTDIENLGSQPETIPVRFEIHDESSDTLVYLDSSRVYLPSGQTARVVFRGWNARAALTYYNVVTVSLPGDQNPANDQLSYQFRVIAETIDIGMTGFVPADTIAAGGQTPSVTFRSTTGNCDITAALEFLKGDTALVYSDTQQTHILQGETLNMVFSTWQADTGQCLARLVAWSDTYSLYDTLRRNIMVLPTGMNEDARQSTPLAWALSEPSPSPSRDKVNISYALPKAADISLKLYDATGQLRAILDQGRKAAGEYSAMLDLRDSRFGITSGVYLIRLISPGFVQTRKVVIAQ